jgi:PEP-CTERM motif
LTADVNLDGTTPVTNSSAQTTVVPATPGVPEPGTLPLMAMGIGLWLAFRFRLHRR